MSVAVLPWLHALIAFHHLRMSGRSVYRYECSQAGLRLHAASGTAAQTQWTTYLSAWETTTAFFLFPSRVPRILLPSWKSAPLIIPKRCCASPRDIDRLRTMMKTALGKRAAMHSS
jgi:hypothetical protein